VLIASWARKKKKKKVFGLPPISVRFGQTEAASSVRFGLPNRIPGQTEPQAVQKYPGLNLVGGGLRGAAAAGRSEAAAGAAAATTARAAGAFASAVASAAATVAGVAGAYSYTNIWFELSDLKKNRPDSENVKTTGF
jgi:hypothetical protein